MSIPCRLLPRPDATADDLRTLGAAVYHLVKSELGPTGFIESADSQDMADLLQGEMPKPLALRIATAHKDFGENLSIPALLDDLGELGKERAISFSLKSMPTTALGAIVGALRRSLPIGIIEDVLIGDQSWNDFKL